MPSIWNLETRLTRYRRRLLASSPCYPPIYTANGVAPSRKPPRWCLRLPVSLIESSARTHKMEEFNGIYLNLSKSSGRCRFAPIGVGWKPQGGGGDQDMFTLEKEKFVNAYWSRAARGYEIKLFTRDDVHQFDGFEYEALERLMKPFKNWYNLTLENKEHALRGWNWGKAEFGKMELAFNVQSRPAFEIPYDEISNTNLAGKTEVAIDLSLPGEGDETGTNGHMAGARGKGRKTGAARDQLVEMRLYVPGTAVKDEQNSDEENGEDGEGAAEQSAASLFYETLLDKANIGQVAGDTYATFPDVLFLTPRGRFDVDIYDNAFRLRGKTYDYKIQYEAVKKTFTFQKPDEQHYMIAMGIDPALRQGQTRYPFLVMQFRNDDEITLDLNLTKEDIDARNASKKEGKNLLQAHYEAPVWQVITSLFKGLTDKKVTAPSVQFSSHHGQQGVKCSIKANEGILYMFDKCFLFVPKPSTFISFDRIGSITLSRVGGAVSASRTFDMAVNMKDGSGSTQFSNINREEQNKLEDFLKAKGLKVKNEMADDIDAQSGALLAAALQDEDLASSEEEAVGVRGSADEDDESVDEDFKGGDEDDDPEEFDSQYESSGGDSDEEMADADGDADGDDDADGDAEEEKPQMVERPKKKAKTSK